MSINRLMDKENVLYIHNRVLFSLKKEGNSDTCYYTTWMNLKISQSQKD